MRAVVFSDVHMDAGWHLGEPDPLLGNTRVRDAATQLSKIVERAVEEEAVLLFAGDLCQTARPTPLIMRIACDALAPLFPPTGNVPLLAIPGNHDWQPTKEGTALDVVTRAAHGQVAHVPDVATWYSDFATGDGELQIGYLPWTPTARGQNAGEQLIDVVAGLSARLDPENPSILIGHWNCGHDIPDFIRESEPWIDPDKLEAASRFDVHLFGHYHARGRVGARTYRIGPPLRSGFGEAELQPGFVIVEWLSPPDGTAINLNYRVEFVDLDDVELVTVVYDSTIESDGLRNGWQFGPEVKDAIVRLVAKVSPEQARALQESADAVIQACKELGARKVLGPEITVVREERERRSALAVDVDPIQALAEYLEREGVEDRDQVLTEAREVIGL